MNEKKTCMAIKSNVYSWDESVHRRAEINIIVLSNEIITHVVMSVCSKLEIYYVVEAFGNRFISRYTFYDFRLVFRVLLFHILFNNINITPRILTL